MITPLAWLGFVVPQDLLTPSVMVGFLLLVLPTCVFRREAIEGSLLLGRSELLQFPAVVLISGCAGFG